MGISLDMFSIFVFKISSVYPVNVVKIGLKFLVTEMSLFLLVFPIIYPF